MNYTDEYLDSHGVLIRSKLNEVRFNNHTNYEVSYLCVAVMLDTGAVELITNMTNIDEKVRYYLNNYDEKMRLNHCKAIRIVDIMVG